MSGGLYSSCRTSLSSSKSGASLGSYYSLQSLNDDRVWALPYSIRVLLESAIRNADGSLVTKDDVEKILSYYSGNTAGNVEVPFIPARVVLQDFTGVPAVVDLAAMRDAVAALGGNPQKVNPLVPVDLVVDHSVQVDVYNDPKAVEKNKAIEMSRNKERFQFIKWGSKAFQNFRVVPPGAGIVHQVNLEYLARVVVNSADEEGGDKSAPVLYPDSCVGTDSHTTMIDGLGVAGWGVGGIEAEAAMLGQPIAMVLPLVVGFHLSGELGVGVTATDLVLTVVEMLRKKKVVGKFVEFYGPGVAKLSLADRATVANMGPEYGATMGFFPIDDVTLDYLTQTGRSDKHVELCRSYAKENGFFLVPETDAKAPRYDDTISLDLSTVVPCLSGPKRPHDRVALHQMPSDWKQCLSAPVGFKGFGLKPEHLDDQIEVTLGGGEKCTLKHGSIVIAAITSCTNTSNPEVMVASGLVAKAAVEKGLKMPAHIKTSLAPGSNVVTDYLIEANLLKPLEALGFGVVGYGCTTCIGNSGELDPAVTEAITSKDLVSCSVLSGNRNFEGRVHPLTRGNYLASPPLVVAYALAGRVDIDFEKEPIGTGKDGSPVFLRDIWPDNQLIKQTVAKVNTPAKYRDAYERIFTKRGFSIEKNVMRPIRSMKRMLSGKMLPSKGKDAWSILKVPGEGQQLFQWDPESTYIKQPPYFDGMTAEVSPVLGDAKKIKDARCLLLLGDSVTTDHISPAGNIALKSPAAKYLMDRGVERKDFNSYGARRGHDEVMARGTFANVRMVNELLKNEKVVAKCADQLKGAKGAPEAPKTLHVPSMTLDYVYNVAQRYANEDKCDMIVIAGLEYGTGSSRDWAAKGPYLLGMKAAIATTFERIHRSNLIGMGVLPLQFKDGESSGTHKLTGLETYTVHLPDTFDEIKPGMTIKVTAKAAPDGVNTTFDTTLRIDTMPEVGYFKNGGILQTVVRQLAK
ncbi:hypothetical protein PPROV_000691200 [Pycnococcus provasolii]|uniref:aconitate hydratase n=2 Tax=Pycnococcus provasolii TaxID=41880 RepID=A0A830HRU1_9CHLO|nr:hypothetical protein PPROV_000691200 [Pycnococcus provasolii]